MIFRWVNCRRSSEWLLEAPKEEKNSLGYLQLGHHYFYGTGGLETSDYAQAAVNYQQAKYLKSPEGAFNTGYMFEWGIGVAQNIQEAIRSYNFSLTLSDDSFVPATIALQRLYFYQFMNDTVAVDLYIIAFDDILYSLYQFLLMPETILFFLIVVLIYFRR